MRKTAMEAVTSQMALMGSLRRSAMTPRHQAPTMAMAAHRILPAGLGFGMALCMVWSSPCGCHKGRPTDHGGQCARRASRISHWSYGAMLVPSPLPATAMIREILKMGDERLLRVAPPVPEAMIGSNELDTLIADMFDTMHDAGGVGLAAPQIGVDLQLVIFGFDSSERYPDAPPVPQTILLNPVITPLSQDMEEAWEGCLSVPGLRGAV